MRQRKSPAEGQEHSRRSVRATGDAQPGTCAGEALLPGHLCSGGLRPASSVGARCLRAEGRTPGPRCSRGPTDRRPAAERGEPPRAWRRGWGQGRGGAGGVSGRARTGWDVTSGALCIVGILGPQRLVPVHSAAEPGGGGERGVCGREARGRAGQRGARREKARAAQRAQTEHLAAAAEPPVSAAQTSPRGALAARPVPAARSGRALPAAGAWERPGLARTGWRWSGSSHRAWRGPRRGLARTAPSRAEPGPRGIPFGFVQKANPEADSSPPRPPARARALLCGGDSWAPSPATLPWAGGQTARPEAGGGPAAPAGRPGPGRPGAVVHGVGLGEAPPARELPAPAQ